MTSRYTSASDSYGRYYSSFIGLSDCLPRILFVLASLIGDIERRRGWPSDALYGGGGTQESFPYSRFQVARQAAREGLKRRGFLEGEGRAQEEGVEDELEAGLAVNEVQEEGLNFGLRDSP
jgi:hypothetical protein